MSLGLEEASQKYGPPRDLVWHLESLAFPPVRERRLGEVCMAIRRKNGRFLLQTKQSYPGAVMRLPSGGIQRDETLERALLREIWEETNLDVRVDAFVARIAYSDRRRTADFRTNLFVCDEVAGELRSNDPKERISEWREAALDELPTYAEHLRAIEPGWRHWGHFRAAALDTLVEFCRGDGR